MYWSNHRAQNLYKIWVTHTFTTKQTGPLLYQTSNCNGRWYNQTQQNEPPLSNLKPIMNEIITTEVNEKSAMSWIGTGT
jgi:hypothetical protein